MSDFTTWSSRPVRSVWGEGCRLLFYFALIAAVLAPGGFLGFTNDESGYVAINTEEFASHPLIPYITHVDVGHPMVYAYLNGLLWRLFGRSNAIANISIWLYGALVLYAVDLLTARVTRDKKKCGMRNAECGINDCGLKSGPRWTGPLAALGVFSSPLFISHAAQYLDAIPYVAFLLLMVLAWAAGRRVQLGCWGLMLALTRMTGCLGMLGLGLFDIGHGWFVARLRTPRQWLAHMLPYLAAGGLFILYWAVKLYLFKLPVSNFKANSMDFNNLATTRLYAQRIVFYILNTPRGTFAPLLWLAGAGAAAAGLRRLFSVERGARSAERRARSITGTSTSTTFSALRPPRSTLFAEDPTPGAAAIYTALLAALLPLALFHCVYVLNPNARWFISGQALLVIAGVHGAATLLGQWRVLALPPLLAWCALQGVFWHRAWVERCPLLPPATRARMCPLPDYTLDLNDRKLLLHDMMDWILKNATSDPAILTGYPTTTPFREPSAGFSTAKFAKSGDFGWLGRDALLQNPTAAQQPTEYWIKRIAASYLDFYVIVGSWDRSKPYLKNFANIQKDYPFRAVFERRSRSGETLTIYQRQVSAAEREQWNKRYQRWLARQRALLKENREKELAKKAGK